jgi:hypothetical protein
LQKYLNFLGATFFHGIGYVLILTNNRLGYSLGDFFTLSSGHPAAEPQRLPRKNGCLRHRVEKMVVCVIVSQKWLFASTCRSIPELIVHPILDTEYVLEEIDQWLPRLHAVVIGNEQISFRPSQ